ncbi:glucose-1-phosphate thymidylyltransferase RfbA [Nocardiopsis sp. MG754419]|uniref:glucose-1-phosphate thymidylyltransferase RfbA n=1 Tax=Nocardiopsis sp. MG754419 TaxID=2259865 RepID=UPI001BA93C48|nr:glucose-1-phosphate thymidylyltransferase RfbA [Nocardiopsis sp. MG754419]MBR8741838.1 glucose-1-phosphate thymidylyltransferase [Nocardiopsis sp. MG754419]
MKGILLAGGSGSRLYPVTRCTSKQMLPVYDKPLIYYPLSVLMLAGVRDILVICAPDSLVPAQRLLEDGAHLGLNISYAEQPEPRGIADAYLIGADHVEDEDSALILGDNIFHGSGFQELLRSAAERQPGCTLFGYPVSDPERFAIGETDDRGNLVSIEEKPLGPRSNNAVTGLYLYDRDVVEIARQTRPSARGELEITDVNRAYLAQGQARIEHLGRGYMWIDAGTPSSLLQAGQYVEFLASLQGVRVACVEEVAARMGLISAQDCWELGARMTNSDYGAYVMSIADDLAEAGRT